jgi:hypothetical protein
MSADEPGRPHRRASELGDAPYIMREEARARTRRVELAMMAAIAAIPLMGICLIGVQAAMTFRRVLAGMFFGG